MAFATGYKSRAGRSRGANMHSGVGNTRPRRKTQTFKPNKGFSGKGSLSAAKPGLGAPGAAAKPAAPKPVGHHAQPDSIYNAQVDLANRENESRLNSLQGQETAVKHEFGIDDPTNPFSRAEGLKRAFLSRYKGVSAGLASQGHLYSGQHERALARTRLEEEQARAELRSAYEGALGQIGDARTASNFQTEEQKNQAFEDWLARAPESTGSVDAATPAAPSAPAPVSAPGAKVTAPGTATAPQVKKVNAPPPNIPGKPTPASGPAANRKLGQPVKGPDRPKGNAEQRLRKELRQAKRNGNAKRVRRLRRRIRALDRGQNYTRG